MSEPASKQAHVWARDPLDFYVEPEDCTDALLTVERFVGQILDPCCGQGNILRACARAAYDTTGLDMEDRGAPGHLFQGVWDFLQHEPWGEPADNIVMNPPFGGGKLAEAFIRHALTFTSGKVCAFVDKRFLTGDKRAEGLFADHPPTRVWIITPRPSCPPGAYLAAGGKAGGGTADYCWLVYDLTAPATGTTLGWLRRPKPETPKRADGGTRIVHKHRNIQA